MSFLSFPASSCSKAEESTSHPTSSPHAIVQNTHAGPRIHWNLLHCPVEPQDNHRVTDCMCISTFLAPSLPGGCVRACPGEHHYGRIRAQAVWWFLPLGELPTPTHPLLFAVEFDLQEDPGLTKAHSLLPGIFQRVLGSDLIVVFLSPEHLYLASGFTDDTLSKQRGLAV